MRRLNMVLMAGTAVAAFAVTAADVHAQAPTFGRSGRPTVSPYLNLYSSGSLETDYYQRVRPQQEFRRDAQQLSSSLNRLQAEFDASVTTPYDRLTQQGMRQRMRTTGHRTVFMDYFGYHNTRTRR